MSEQLKRLGDIKALYAYWNEDKQLNTVSTECSPLDCNTNMCHFDGSCGGDGE